MRPSIVGGEIRDSHAHYIITNVRSVENGLHAGRHVEPIVLNNVRTIVNHEPITRDTKKDIVLKEKVIGKQEGFVSSKKVDAYDVETYYRNAETLEHVIVGSRHDKV